MHATLITLKTWLKLLLAETSLVHDAYDYCHDLLKKIKYFFEILKDFNKNKNFLGEYTKKQNKK